MRHFLLWENKKQAQGLEEGLWEGLLTAGGVQPLEERLLHRLKDGHEAPVLVRVPSERQNVGVV